MEAPAIFKHKGKYYFIASGCTGWAPNAARSAVAKNIAGPWTELKNPCVGPKARHHVRRPEHFHPARAGQARKIHLHGGHLAAQKCH